MANHNVLITNPQGERRNQFHENVSLDDAKDWLEEFGPAPIGWNYQIINTARKKRKQVDHILVQGFGKEGNMIASTRARHRTNYGWYTVRMAKRDLRKLGASYFTQEKVWPDDNTKAG